MRQTDIDWTFFHRPVTLRRRMGWEREGEVSETTSGEANFSSRFSRIILKKKKKTFNPKFSDGWWRVFRRTSRGAALKGETADFPDRHQKVFGFSQFLRICMRAASKMCHVFCYKQGTKRIEISCKVQLFVMRHFFSRNLRLSIFCRKIVAGSDLVAECFEQTLLKQKSPNTCLVAVFKIVTPPEFLT